MIATPPSPPPSRKFPFLISKPDSSICKSGNFRYFKVYVYTAMFSTFFFFFFYKKATTSLYDEAFPKGIYSYKNILLPQEKFFSLDGDPIKEGEKLKI